MLYNYLFLCTRRCICGKGEFCCLFSARFSFLCLRFVCNGQKWRVLHFPRCSIVCIEYGLYALWFACFNWNIIYVANSKRFFSSPLAATTIPCALHVCGIRWIEIIRSIHSPFCIHYNIEIHRFNQCYHCIDRVQIKIKERTEKKSAASKIEGVLTR